MEILHCTWLQNLDIWRSVVSYLKMCRTRTQKITSSWPPWIGLIYGWMMIYGTWSRNICKWFKDYRLFRTFYWISQACFFEALQKVRGQAGSWLSRHCKKNKDRKLLMTWRRCCKTKKVQSRNRRTFLWNNFRLGVYRELLVMSKGIFISKIFSSCPCSVSIDANSLERMKHFLNNHPLDYEFQCWWSYHHEYFANSLNII